MSLLLKPPVHEHEDPFVQPAIFGDGGDAPENASPAPAVERSVIVQHGIHRGHFPVGGLRVREARQTLTHLMNIDPQAAAVIDGQIVDEETVIREDIAMLSFVKPSAVKG